MKGTRREPQACPQTSRVLAVATVLTLMWMCGCGTGRKLKETSLTSFAGIYRTGFEQSDFQPCGRQTVWWLKNPGILFQTYPGLRSSKHLYIRFRGRRSPVGRYGHLGSYPVEVEIVELLSATQTIPADCAGSHGTNSQ